MKSLTRTQNKPGKILLLIILVFMFANTKAQQSYTPEMFSGDWFFPGSGKVMVNDTINLSSDLPDAELREYTKWIFSEQSIFDIYIYANITDSDGEWISASRNKNVEDHWLYDKTSNQLIINTGESDQVYKIISMNKENICLVRSK